MNSKTRKFLKQYLKISKKELFCSKQNKKEYIAQTKRNIEMFLTENPEADFSNMVMLLGAADDSVSLFMSDISADERRCAKKKKRNGRFVLIGALIVILCVSFFTVCYLAYHSVHSIETVVTHYNAASTPL